MFRVGTLGSMINLRGYMTQSLESMAVADWAWLWAPRQAQQAQDAQVVFPADDAACRRALLVGNLHPAVNTDQVRESHPVHPAHNTVDKQEWRQY